MTYEEFFGQVKEIFSAADVSKFDDFLAFQFNIVGEAEGAFYVELKDHKLNVEPYEYYDRHAIFITSADTLSKIANGQKDPIAAYTNGELRIEGDLDKAIRFKDIVDLCQPELAKKKTVAKKVAEKAVKKAVEKKVAADKKAEEKKAATVEKKTTATAEKKAAAPAEQKAAAREEKQAPAKKAAAKAEEE